MKFKFKPLVFSFVVFIGIVLTLFAFDIIWRSPPFYKTVNSHSFEVPIQDMETYMKQGSNHRRPYIYTLKSKTKGQAIILGIKHINDPKNPQFDSIRSYWKAYKPTIALVEGRLGFFAKWIQNPIESYGESGLVSYLAKQNNIPLYTWEPNRENEIENLIQKHSAKELAMFYSLRPFYGASVEERKNDPEKKLQNLIDERTDYEHLKGAIKKWEEIDSIWKRDFPNLDWRSYSTGYGWPGYLHDIWNNSNLYRDEHMLKIIIEEVKKGETVLVTMGASHAPRIENTLKNELKNL